MEKRTQVLSKFGNASSYQLRYIWFNPNDPHFLRYSFNDDFGKIKVFSISPQESVMTCTENPTLNHKMLLGNFTCAWKISFSSIRARAHFRLFFETREEFQAWKQVLENARSSLPSSKSGDEDIMQSIARSPWFQQEVNKKSDLRYQAPPPCCKSDTFIQTRLDSRLPVHFCCVLLPFQLGRVTCWIQHRNVTIKLLKHGVFSQLQPLLGAAANPRNRLEVYQERFIRTGSKMYGFRLFQSSTPPPPPCVGSLGSDSLSFSYDKNDEEENMSFLTFHSFCDEENDMVSFPHTVVTMELLSSFPLYRHFRIRIQRTAREYDALSTFTVYFLKVQFADRQWEVKRRFAEVKHVFGAMEKSFSVEQLNYVLEHPNSSSSCSCASLGMLQFVGCASLARKSNTLPLLALNRFVQTGDVVLFRSVNAMSGFQRSLLQCSFDHVGIVVQRNQSGYELLEATGEGVTSFPLGDRIHAYSQGFCDVIAVRKVHFQRTAPVLLNLIQWTNQVEGKPYKLTVGKLALGRVKSSSSASDIPKRAYFCSELVAEALKILGVLKKEDKREEYYLPHYFEVGGLAEVHLLPGSTLGANIVEVDCVRPEIESFLSNG